MSAALTHDRPWGSQRGPAGVTAPLHLALKARDRVASRLPTCFGSAATVGGQGGSPWQCR